MDTITTRETAEKELDLCRVDPVRFVERYCTISGSGGTGPIELTEYQKHFLRNLRGPGKTSVFETDDRSTGKTTAGRLASVSRAILFPGSSVVIYMKSNVRARDALRTITADVDSLPGWLRQKMIVKNDSIEFENGSRIFVVTRPESFRGKRAEITIVDLESVYSTEKERAELFRSVDPRSKVGIVELPPLEPSSDKYERIKNDEEVAIRPGVNQETW